MQEEILIRSKKAAYNMELFCNIKKSVSNNVINKNLLKNINLQFSLFSAQLRNWFGP